MGTIFVLFLIFYCAFGIGAYIGFLQKEYLGAVGFLIVFLILNGWLFHRIIGYIESGNHRRIKLKSKKSQSKMKTALAKEPQYIPQTQERPKYHFVTNSKNNKKPLTKKELETIKQEALQELENLIGMDKVKEQVKRFLNYVDVEKEKELMGLPTSHLTLHMLLLGEVGTGKTSLARIMGKFLHGAGFLSKGHFVETDREGLVGEYVGHTAPKTLAKCQEAMGGILFVDEAYALKSEGNDFGKEAVSTFMKFMEDNKHDFVIILAGYDKEMSRFLKINSGLPSRFPHRFEFPNYNPYELYQIAYSMMYEKQMYMDSDTQKALYQYITEHWLPREKVNGNGRWVRNFVEQIRIAQNNRIAFTHSKDYQTIQLVDIEEALEWIVKQT